LQFLIGEAGKTVSVNLYDAPNSVSEGIGEPTRLPEPNGNIVYRLGQLEIFPGMLPDSVGIAPMILLGNSVETCDVAATVSPIPVCI
jgi:hypothetical protein